MNNPLTTPGPWIVSGLDPDLEGYKVTDGRPSQDDDGDGASEYIATVYDEANADLIAAAPELMAEALETLQWARVFVTSGQRVHPVGADLYDETIAKLKATLQ